MSISHWLDSQTIQTLSSIIAVKQSDKATSVTNIGSAENELKTT